MVAVKWRHHVNRLFNSRVCLCVKTSLSAKPFLWKCVSPTSSFSCKSNSFSYERFWTRTRFETEANQNSEMGYTFGAVFCYRKIMDTKFHLCLLLIILGSITMQVQSQLGEWTFMDYTSLNYSIKLNCGREIFVRLCLRNGFFGLTREQSFLVYRVLWARSWEMHQSPFTLFNWFLWLQR